MAKLDVDINLSPSDLERLAELVAARLEAKLQSNSAPTTYTLDDLCNILQINKKRAYAIRAANPELWTDIGGRDYRITPSNLERLLAKPYIGQAMSSNSRRQLRRWRRSEDVSTSSD